MSANFDLSNEAREAFGKIKNLRERGREEMGQDPKRSAYLPSPDDASRPVHLVMQGGGTLGIAHLGFVRGLEAAGLRFAGLAGTSAGAIISLLIACARASDPDQEVSGRLLPLLLAMPTNSFMDGPFHARRLVKYALNPRGASILEYVLPAVTAWHRLVNDHGLHRGDRFMEWLQRTLEKEFGVITVLDLRGHLDNIAGKLGFGERGEEFLHIVATAMPMGLKMVFPRHANLFHLRYLQHSPAVWARASMSVPLFFEPFQMDLNADRWNEFVDDLKGHYPEQIISDLRSLKELHFIDGGLLSNFPIDAFSQLGRPNASATSAIETIGVALVPGSRNSVAVGNRGSTRTLLRHAAAVAGAVRHSRDYEALERSHMQARLDPSSPETQVVFIDTGEHNWLNFSLDQDAMEDLYLRGLRTCAAFLEKVCKLKATVR